jgi:poly(3-hydroxybutyrate) depolymerase
MRNFRKALAVATLCLIATQVQAAESLHRYNIDITSTTVSGLSSGAFMAQQFHFAESDIVNGVAIIAGGPFYCAKGRLILATDKCMQPKVDGGPSAAESLDAAQKAERKGLIPSLANIENDKVYIFTGTQDTTVNPAASAATRSLYTNLGVKADNLLYVNTVPAGHANVTLDHGNDCASTASPYIVDCDRDEAGNILEFLIGDLNPKATELTGQIIEFSQKEFSPKPEAISMADTGYVYVPKACADGQPCKLHVAIHGCKQNTATIGTAYVTDTGYLPWADSNNIVLLFPQTIARNDYALGGVVNPNACWNWWGYGGDDNYHTRIGYQVAAIRSMVDRLAGGR